MAKRWSVTSLVALALLGCLIHTQPSLAGLKGGQSKQTPWGIQPWSWHQGTPPNEQNPPPPNGQMPPPPNGQNPPPPSSWQQGPPPNGQTSPPSSSWQQGPPHYHYSGNHPQYPGHHHQYPGHHHQYPGHHHKYPGGHHHVWWKLQYAHDQATQDPKIPQTPSKQVPIPAQSCDISLNVRIPCGGSDISADGCRAINCCFNGLQCYFGKAVTIQCTKDGQFIVVVARDATLPNIDLESISLLDQGTGCKHVDSNSAFAIFNFPVTSCGSVVMEEPGVIIYENRMSSSYEMGVGPLGIITRDSQYELLFQCRYIGTSVETVVVELISFQSPPLPVAALGPIRVHLKLANGQCITKGCNEVDAAYSSYYTLADYPVAKVLREPVYVEVQLLGKTDPNLLLSLGRCWATISPNPHSLPQWDLLIDACPYKDDRYLSTLVPVGPSSGLEFPSHYRRFFFKMFTFLDPNSMAALKEPVYIHCSTTVSAASAGYSYEPVCFVKSKRDVTAVDQQKTEPKVVVSVGPVNMGASAE